MIRKIELDGFRLLDNFSAELGQLSVVIGANATGKSTLLEAVQLIAQCAEFSLSDALLWHGGLASVLTATKSSKSKLGWSITFEKPRHHRYWSTVPLGAERLLVYEVAIGTDALGEPTPEKEVLRNADPHRGYKDPFKLLDARGSKSMIYKPSKGELVPFDQAVASQAPLLPLDDESGSEPYAVDEAAKTKNSLRLSQIRFFNDYPQVSFIRVLLGSMGAYPGFDVGRDSTLRTQPADIRPETVLTPNGSNLGTVLHEVLTRHTHRECAETIIEFLRIAYPSFEGIFVETARGTPPKLLVRVREKGMQRSMELWDLSDGMLRFLCLATALLVRSLVPLVAIDEPEIGLHPRLLPVVADMIKAAAERTQVLVTTHSPDLLNRFDIADVAVVAREGCTVSWKRPGDRKTLRRMLESVTGDGLGDLHRSGELEAL